MAVFDRLDRLTSRAVDGLNAIPFEFIPQRSTPNGRSSADPTRTALPSIDVPVAKGIFDYYSTEYGVQLGVRKSYREANDLRALQVGRDPQLSIDRRYWPSPEWEPKQGDYVRFPTRADLPDFQVISTQRDGMARMVLMLTQLGAQT